MNDVMMSLADDYDEIRLNIIRNWEDGFAERLECVWKDVIGLTPNYKLYDLQRTLAEFGLIMVVYEKRQSQNR